MTDGRVEVTAGDVPDGGRHHSDREAVGEGDADQGRIAGGRGDGDRPCADEDERERAHELGDRAPEVVALHAGAS